jgi:WD40 repeat protein
MKSKKSYSNKIFNSYNIPLISDTVRFIPSKKLYEQLELQLEFSSLKNEAELNENFTPNLDYKINLRQELLKKTVLFQKNQTKFNPFQEKKLYSLDMLDNFKKSRHINNDPFKVLDAPNLQDDFYLNVLDWSKKNILAVGLGSSVYTWNFTTNEVEKITEFTEDDQNNYVASVTWSDDGSELVIGSMTGWVSLWDVNKSKSCIFFK